jgi:hypothetical protein
MRGVKERKEKDEDTKEKTWWDFPLIFFVYDGNIQKKNNFTRNENG